MTMKTGYCAANYTETDLYDEAHCGPIRASADEAYDDCQAGRYDGVCWVHRDGQLSVNERTTMTREDLRVCAYCADNGFTEPVADVRDCTYRIFDSEAPDERRGGLCPDCREQVRDRVETHR
jgi:hypothetical protein